CGRMFGPTRWAVEDPWGVDRPSWLRKRAAASALGKYRQAAREHVWQTRVRWAGGMLAKAGVRNHALAVGQPASFDTEDQAPSAIEYLLTALGGALVTGLQWRLSRRGIEVRHLEAVVKGRAEGILTFLGVEQDGHPGLSTLSVTVYADADAEPQVLD